MPEIKVETMSVCEEEGALVELVTVGSGGAEMSCIWREVHRCWCWRLCRIWMVVAARGFPEAEAESMSFVSDEGCEAGFSIRLVAILSG